MITPPRTILLSLRCSALAAFGGWLALNGILLPLLALSQRIYTDWVGGALLGGVSALFIAAASALVLLPVLLFTPAQEPLLHWPVLSMAGGFAGSVVLAGFYLLTDHTPSMDFLALCLGLGAFPGAVAGGCAAWLLQSQRIVRPPRPAL